jgi:hypothetical protein
MRVILNIPAEYYVELIEDIDDYDSDNSDASKTYESNHFSSYNGIPVIRHSLPFMTSWAISGTIFLNHNLDNTTMWNKCTTIDHESGHIYQEQELGSAKYIFAVAIPSVVTNIISRFVPEVYENYFNFPWEYDADRRGGIERETHAPWAGQLADLWFSFWEVV